jgi:hypothetical protein
MEGSERSFKQRISSNAPYDVVEKVKEKVELLSTQLKNLWKALPFLRG